MLLIYIFNYLYFEEWSVIVEKYIYLFHEIGKLCFIKLKYKFLQIFSWKYWINIRNGTFTLFWYKFYKVKPLNPF